MDTAPTLENSLPSRILFAPIETAPLYPITVPVIVVPAAIAMPICNQKTFLAKAPLAKVTRISSCSERSYYFKKTKH
jgi:hypothetical protein